MRAVLEENLYAVAEGECRQRKYCGVSPTVPNADNGLLEDSAAPSELYSCIKRPRIRGGFQGTVSKSKARATRKGTEVVSTRRGHEGHGKEVLLVLLI